MIERMIPKSCRLFGRDHAQEVRRVQRSFGDGLIAAEVDDLREPLWRMPTRCWRIDSAW
jgi:hypothetical protein